MKYQKKRIYINAVSLYRIYSHSFVKKLPPLRKLLEALNYFLFNCSLPSTCTIGENTYCSHRGMSVVIHRKAVIGKDCKIGTCVTIGGKGKAGQGAPVIGDNVYLATGCKIIGNVTVGSHAVIGANSVVTKDVPDGATVVGIPARIINRG